MAVIGVFALFSVTSSLPVSEIRSSEELNPIPPLDIDLLELKTSFCRDDDTGMRQASGGAVQNCAVGRSMCGHSGYGHVVKNLCPKTCGLCHAPAGGSDADCTDDDDGIKAASGGHIGRCAAATQAYMCKHSVVAGLCRKTCGGCGGDSVAAKEAAAAEAAAAAKAAEAAREAAAKREAEAARAAEAAKAAAAKRAEEAAAAEKAACKDDDQGLTAVSGGFVRSCAQANVKWDNYCQDPTHGPLFRRLCKKSCGECP